jgi:ATP-dependent helicase HrpB
VSGTRKIVLTTAIAETSLTIEGVRIVIDSGTMRVPRFDPRTGLTRLDTITITQDSAEQRRGRAGRLEPGACYRLWTAAEQKTLLPRRPPEMLDADLAPLRLELAAWGATDPQSLPWLTPPPTGATTQANDLLTRLGALDAQGRITDHGRRMAECPLHPRLAHMVLKAVPLGLGRLACDVAALLGERDVLRGPSGWRNADVRLRLDALHGHVLQDAAVTVDRGAIQRVSHVVEQVMSYVNRDSLHVNRQNRKHQDQPSLDRLGLLLAFAYPDRIAQRQAGDERRYLLTNGRGAVFTHPDPLASEPYLVIVDLEGGHEWARIFLTTPVALADVEMHMADQVRDVEFVVWDDRAQAVRARKQRQLGGLVLKDQALVKPSPDQVSAALMQGIRQAGILALPWTKELLQWKARIEFLRRLNGQERTWPDVSNEALLDRVEEWLMPYVTGLTHLEQVQRMDLVEPLQALLTWEQRRQLDQLAPTHVSVPTGSRLQVDYRDVQRPVLAVRLQEMFGCQETPKVAGGMVSLVLHLLSPGGRPVQVTQDLRQFWQSSYQEVRKALRGRYPKHSWPDDPLSAQPTRRTKGRR